MTTVSLPPLAGGEHAAWSLLLDLAERTRHRWVLVGGLMVRLHCYEHGANPRRQTDDADVLVDISAGRAQALRAMSDMLVDDFGMLLRANTDQVAHRFVRDGVALDLLAPDRFPKADLTTVPPGRTVAAPGGRAVLRDAEPVELILDSRRGRVERPPLARSIVSKWRAYAEIPDQQYRDRHLLDLAVLLSLANDPRDLRAQLTSTQDRRRLSELRDKMEAQIRVWRQAVGDTDAVLDVAYALAG